MLNRKMSAGTAAQKRSKSSLLARPALLLAIPMLSAVFCPVTRYELLDKMKEGIKCEVPQNVSPYNRELIDFWTNKFGYKKTKSENKGMIIYEPI